MSPLDIATAARKETEARWAVIDHGPDNCMIYQPGVFAWKSPFGGSRADCDAWIERKGAEAFTAALLEACGVRTKSPLDLRKALLALAGGEDE